MFTIKILVLPDRQNMSILTPLLNVIFVEGHKTTNCKKPVSWKGNLASWEHSEFIGAHLLLRLRP